MKPPAFQFYPSDFLASTAEMTAEEVGVHIRLLCHQWIKGGLPNDDTRLASMAGQCHGNAIAYAKTRFRICDDGQLRHPRLEAEREKQAEYRAKQAGNANKRWHGNATAYATALPTHMPNACSPSPSPSSDNTLRPPSGDTVTAAGDGKPGVGGENEKPKRREAKPRERNPLFDALAELDGGAENLTPTAASRVGAKLAGIRKASPDVTPEEIRRRAANLRALYPTARATASSLEANWGACAGTPAPLGKPAIHPDRLTPDQLRGAHAILRARRESLPSCFPTARPAMEREIADLEAKIARHEATIPQADSLFA